MADRFVLKQFAGSATNNGAFGAAQATGAGVQPVANIKDVQSLNAFEQGWNSATLTADKLPALEEMQGLEALLCKAIKENYSEGIPFWISGETYYQYSFVNYNGIIYYNTTGSYTANNPAIDTANWAAYNKVGTATVGTDDTPIYLNVGTPTAGKRIGVVAYDNTKTYNLDDVVLNVDSSGAVELYLSLAASNTSALTDTTKWKKVSLGGSALPLLTHFWSDHEINEMPFLRADTFSWQDGTVYSNAYNHLVDDIDGVSSTTETIGSYTVTFYRAADGHKIVLADQETTVSNIYTATGVAWYYVLDTANNRFKLPRTKYGFDGLRGNVGDYIAESLPNITGSFTVVGSEGSTSPTGALYGVTANISETGQMGTAGVLKGIDASRSSSAYQNSAPVQQRGTQMYLYFYVGQYTQSAIEQTAGLNAELFNGKADIDLSNLSATGNDKFATKDASNFSSAGKSFLSGLGTPGSRTNLTIATSGSSYTAPANGYFTANFVSTTNSRALVVLENTTRYIGSADHSYTNGTYMLVNVPAQKGDRVVFLYEGGNVNYLKFVYAKGEN